MNRVYVIAPLFLTLAFTTYYFGYWTKKQDARHEDHLRAAIEAERDGIAYLGRDGKKEADEDIARGIPKLKLYGKERADIAERTLLFHERFGVTLEPITGCAVTDPLVRYAEAYNATIRSYVAAKFGSTALEDVDREALRLWEARRKNEKGF